ncbi:FGGY family carbohydrate kinase [Actinotignum urinale]|uniref:xylulokinase n=1 Tax=Actinotignum urinale TaxID=190146 RepID=UPI000C7FB743|nr:FGGY family carbohydrate kinase [Actinotignum urinale]WIK58846.1 FGGY family carbohydrate kinase [Actinotignum urinale]
MAIVAGVDSSTQSTKILVIDTETGATLREGRAPHPEGTEVHPHAWYTAFEEAVTSIGGIDDVEAISVAGQQHGCVLLDAQGAVIRPAQLWNDTKSAQAARELISEFGEDFWAKSVGSVPVASLTVTKLRWLADNEPENVDKIAAVCLPHDWLSWKISSSTDLRDLATDRSDASGTGYVDCETDAYRYDIIAAALRISEDKARSIIFPKIVAPYEKIGVLGEQWGTAIIGPGAGDNAGATLGLNLKHGQATLSIGTSGVVAAISPHPVQDAKSGITGFSDANGEWLPLACTLNGSLIQNYFCELLGVSFEELGKLASMAEPGAGGMVLVPYFGGERTPNLPHANASIHGMTPSSMTRENFARLAYEGLACLMRGALETIRQAGITVDSALLIGGAAQSLALTHIMADILDIPLEVPQPGEYVAKGAARQAARVLGATSEGGEWEPRIIRRITPQEPNPSWERYANITAQLFHS